MARLSRIADVQIALRTTAITEQSFSDMLILGEHSLDVGRAMVITGPDELLDLGMESTDPIYIAASNAFSQIPAVRQVYIGRRDSLESVTDALAAVNGEMSNWYGLVITSRTEADVLAAAAWAEANEKLFGTASDDSDILSSASSDDLASQLMESQYYRTFVFYSEKAATQYPEAAIMSSMFTYYAGQENWALKKMAGISYDALSEGQAIVAHSKNASTFELFRNFAVTQGGKVAAGEYIDVIRLRDQLVESIKVSVVSTMINADGKIPYTDTGIQIIVNAIRSPLDLNVRRGGIAPEELDEDNKVIPSYTISYPRSSQVPFNDKANRILNDVKFTARLAGAINLVVMRGSLSYEL